MTSRINIFLTFLIMIIYVSCSIHRNKETVSKVETVETIQDSTQSEPDWLIQERIKWNERYNHLVKMNLPWISNDTAEISKLYLIGMMNKILPEVIRYANSDSNTVFYNNVMQKRFPEFYAFYQEGFGDTTQTVLNVEFNDIEDNDVLVIGKFIDGKQTFAIAYDIKNSSVIFYRLVKDKWKKIGDRQQQKDETYQKIYFEELNGKQGLEIIMATHPNMNGNMWMEVFSYLENEDKIIFSGDFSTNYEINLKDTTITEDYGGSWYMDQTKTLYTWRNNFLVPIRKSILIVPKSMDSSTYKLEYYENLSNKNLYDSTECLNLIFGETYNKRNKKHKKYWNDFFTLGKYN